MEIEKSDYLFYIIFFLTFIWIGYLLFGKIFVWGTIITIVSIIAAFCYVFYRAIGELQMGEDDDHR